MAVFSVKNKTYSRSLLVGNAAYIPQVTSVEYLVVAGGAGGGSGNSGDGSGGGGGAGGYRTATDFAVTPGSPITVTVGAVAGLPVAHAAFEVITT